MHGALLEKTLQELQVPFEMIGRATPVYRGKNYRMVGACMAKVLEEERKIELFGRSSGYPGLGTNAEHLDKLRLKLPEWTFEIRKGLFD